MNIKQGLLSRFIKWVANATPAVPQVVNVTPFSQQWAEHLAATYKSMQRKDQ